MGVTVEGFKNISLSMYPTKEHAKNVSDLRVLEMKKNKFDINQLLEETQTIEFCGKIITYDGNISVFSAEIADAFVEMTYNFYLQHHSRLPGSYKTKRLRKKRQSIVFDFMARNLDL